MGQYTRLGENAFTFRARKRSKNKDCCTFEGRPVVSDASHETRDARRRRESQIERRCRRRRARPEGSAEMH